MREIQIREEPVEVLSELSSISICYTVQTILEIVRVDRGLAGYRITEKAVAPYQKDYDVDAGEGPARWSDRFDVANWGVIGAWSEHKRVGSAVIAFRSSELHMLENREDMAVLWDMRVTPNLRKTGIGSALFAAVERWARKRGCNMLKVETQNVNPDACRFYAKRGCVLGGINLFAYPSLPDEAQMLWYKELSPGEEM
jgi:GNAT superfamily N-acetyltransferase